MKLGKDVDPKCVWPIVEISTVAQVNPKVAKSNIADDTEVSFVPMPSVEAESGAIDVSVTRRFHEVKKGYTGFLEGDVLFAKITPCMENGKMAIAPTLKNGLGFGSTEFHVLRPSERILAQYLYYFVSSKSFRFEAEHKMTGAVGQKRVPTAFLSEASIPLPPIPDQRRIVDKIESLFSEIDHGIASLEKARKQLEVYRQAVLKHAFEGKLTEKWREENPDKLESPEVLLERIREEAAQEYEQKFKTWEVEIGRWERGGKLGKRPPKPRLTSATDGIKETIEIPDTWALERIGNLNVRVFDGPFGSNLKSSDYVDHGVRVIRLENVGSLEFRDEMKSYVSNEKYEALEKHSVHGGDVIVASFVGDSVRAVVLPSTIDKAINKADCFCVRIGGSRVLPDYLAKYLCSRPAYTQIKSEIHGVGRPRINTTQLKSLPVPICTPEEQADICSILDTALREIQVQASEISRTTERSITLRQSILREAFSGTLVD